MEPRFNSKLKVLDFFFDFSLDIFEFNQMKDNPNKISTKKNSWKLYIQKKILEYLKNISIINQKKKKENNRGKEEKN